ncbi:NADPH-dependent FMN reductase [Fibrella arboris]|uniref:NADPH-dependent FMN reductase n=1 Tax=Fibrella arboris TaxID=3242486 RepID=UPI003522226D
MNILGLSGSLRSGSTNAQVLLAVGRLLPPSVQLTIYEGLDALPHFSPERDNETIPMSVRALRQAIGQAQAVIICTPEYAFGIPGVLKNALDWCVSTVLFDQKPVAAISASPGYAGGERAMASLLPTLTALNTHIPGGCSLVLSSIRTKMNASGEIIDPATEQALQRLADELVADAN